MYFLDVVSHNARTEVIINIKIECKFIVLAYLNYFINKILILHTAAIVIENIVLLYNSVIVLDERLYFDFRTFQLFIVFPLF